MKTTLIVLSTIEVLVLVLVLAGYLIAIARTLRGISQTLGLVTFGVRAIEQQTAPVGALLGDINAALEEAARIAGVSAEVPMMHDSGLDGVEHHREPEVRS